MPNVSNLVKKTDCNTKINEIKKKTTDHDHDKYINIPEFNKLTAENFAPILAQANLASKIDIGNFVKKTDFDDNLKNSNKKVISNKTKHLLVTIQSYFINDGAQLYLIFQSIYKTITTFSGLPDTISQWEYKGLSNEKIIPHYAANKSLSPGLVWYNYKAKLKFKGTCIKQEDQAVFNHKKCGKFFYCL